MEVVSCQPLFDKLTHFIKRAGSLKEFSKQGSSIAMIRYCLQAEFLHENKRKINLRKEIKELLDALYRECESHGKSEVLAHQAKEKGSKAYLKKQDTVALESFTECIRLAPTDSNVLPLGYANRSAVLFQMGKYKEALVDITQAEGSGYPLTLLHKLLLRRHSCYLKLGEEEKARDSFEVCKKHIPNVPEEARGKYKKTLEEVEKSNQTSCNSPCATDDMLHMQEPALFMGENSAVKYMTSAFDMSVNERHGRHVLATSSVSKGSTVFVEKPFAAILLPENHNSHCHTCFAPLLNPLPCHKCRDSVFCDEECRDRGSQWHQYECQILHILSTVGIAHLAVRVVLVAGWKICSMIRDEETGDRVAGVGENGLYNGSNLIDGYRSVYHLIPHLDNCLPEDQLQYCLAAILLATVIHENTNFLKQTVEQAEVTAKSETSSSEQVDIGCLASLLMRHIAQLVSNAHAITQIMASSTGDMSRVEQVTQQRIASAIYPTASLMNHSCKPNIINSFYKDLLVIRTVEDVEPGNQIYNCYGPHYCRQPRSERQELLKSQYFFTCKCEPCIQPQYLQREAAWNGFLCRHCRGVATWMGKEEGSGDKNTDSSQGVLVCLSCHKLERPSQAFVNTCTEVHALYEEGEAALKRGDVSSAVLNLRRALALGSAVYLPSNQYHNLLRDTLARALSEAGDFEGCVKEIRKCIDVTKSRYGDDSIELAHELLKLLDVLSLLADKDQKLEKEKEDTKKQIDSIFTIHYGPQWKKYLGSSST